MGYDEAITMHELVRAIRECKRGVSYKATPMDWYYHSLMRAETLKRDISSGRYKLRPGCKVQIYRPKRREAVAPWFRDRVWQRSMCNNGIYEDLTRDFIFDNPACQIGKGTDQVVRRTVQMLRKLYMKDGMNDGYGIHIDVRKYFPSTPHSLLHDLDEAVITDRRYMPFLHEIVESTTDERAAEDKQADPFGERGTGLGSPINQLHQVALLSHLDHELKCFCKYYERYNDDFLVLDKNKATCERARELISERLYEMGLTSVDKSGVFQLCDGFYFLRKRFVLTDTGKVIIKMHPSTPKSERRALLGMNEALKRGEITMDDIRNHYQAFIANASYCTCTGLVRDMDSFYTKVFRERPKYKKVRRIL